MREKKRKKALDLDQKRELFVVLMMAWEKSRFMIGALPGCRRMEMEDWRDKSENYCAQNCAHFE
jgi:hypothetical protein